MIDLHAHLLPGVDDGPTTWDEAVEMVRMAAADGIKSMAATSHMTPFAHLPVRGPCVEQLRPSLPGNPSAIADRQCGPKLREVSEQGWGLVGRCREDPMRKCEDVRTLACSRN